MTVNIDLSSRVAVVHYTVRRAPIIMGENGLYTFWDRRRLYMLQLRLAHQQVIDSIQVLRVEEADF